MSKYGLNAAAIDSALCGIFEEQSQLCSNGRRSSELDRLHDINNELVSSVESPGAKNQDDDEAELKRCAHQLLAFALEQMYDCFEKLLSPGMRRGYILQQVQSLQDDPDAGRRTPESNAQELELLTAALARMAAGGQ